MKAEVFDIVAKYQAKADGKTDISTPLLNAWKEACASETASQVVIPKGSYYLTVAQLSGPCKAPIEVKLQGTVMAPADPHFFKDPNWVVFNNIDHFTLSGGGTFDGQGKTTWGKNDCAKNKYCKSLPINLRFNFVTNAMIRDITTKDSKQFNVNVLGCKNVTFEHLTVSNPEDSINTDGIHLGRSDGVTIQYSEIKTGDDCISVGDGMKNLHVNGVSCGPGHGISVGSLGKFQGEEPVEGIFIKNCTITGTQNGVRIKSWPASYPGTASDMHFEDIKMDNVGNAILIDQEYCPWNLCNLNMPSKIKLSKISFKNIKGTSSTKEAVKLVCSSSHPCDNVELANIDLTYKGPDGPATSRCTNVKPLLSGTMNPKACTAAPAPTAQ
ncbi:Glycoside hydrolase, family 28 [Corchorus capsularis]|uniref:Polygalacturonase n=1 Tax=Corchorus capsularis TaxID=210143 RepID=A0A1R3G4G1_COCAP|nr:Glycoside hydrolase, family 28 [Corchorus capsularis]